MFKLNKCIKWTLSCTFLPTQKLDILGKMEIVTILLIYLVKMQPFYPRSKLLRLLNKWKIFTILWRAFLRNEFISFLWWQWLRYLTHIHGYNSFSNKTKTKKNLSKTQGDFLYICFCFTFVRLLSYFLKLVIERVLPLFLSDNIQHLGRRQLLNCGSTWN